MNYEYEICDVLYGRISINIPANYACGIKAGNSYHINKNNDGL